MILTTTLNSIRAHSPCKDGWKKLLKNLGKTRADDEVLEFKTILDSNGLDDTLWCLRVEPQYSNLYRLFVVRQVRKAQHLMKDQRSLDALDVAERHAKGQASGGELAVAWAAAWYAARDAARDAAWDAAWYAARGAAQAAARDAARDAALDAAWYAARGAAQAVARDAAWDATRDAAWDAAWGASKQDFIEAFCCAESQTSQVTT